VLAALVTSTPVTIYLGSHYAKKLVKLIVENTYIVVASQGSQMIQGFSV
jgi:hypothetical protein